MIECYSELIKLFICFIGIFVPLIRFISLNVYRRFFRQLFTIAIILLPMSVLLLNVIPDKFSLLLTGPISSLIILYYGEYLYLQLTGEEIFEADENSFNEEENPFFMGLYNSILFTLAIMSSWCVYLIFS